MKICMISMTNIFLCPYIKKYMSYIEENVKVDLIYWNRHDVEEVMPEFNKIFSFNLRINERNNYLKKFYSFIKFKEYCIRIIKQNNYKKIIILHNYMAILMQHFLQKKYQGEYVIDIRDYSFENNLVFYKLEKKAILNSGLAVISSEGYKEFLPKFHYIICHNDPQTDDLTISNFATRSLENVNPIRISFIGLVRFSEQNKKLLDMFGNDERFLLAYYGQNSEILKKYAKDNGIKNVVFKGRFPSEETIDLYMQTDIINNYYGNNTPILEYALSNKLYYAATFRIPILVCKNTYMEKIAKKFHFGIELDETKKDCVERFYQTYLSIDRNLLNAGCESFLNQVKKDNEIFRAELNKFINR